MKPVFVLLLVLQKSNEERRRAAAAARKLTSDVLRTVRERQSLS